MPVRLFATRGDEQAVTANTPLCRSSFRTHHVRAQVGWLPAHLYQRSPHLGTAITGTERALHWFRHLG